MVMYFFQKDILRISSFFTAFDIEDIKLHEANNFGAQISNARVKMEDVEVACVWTLELTRYLSLIWSISVATIWYAAC